MKGKEGGQTEEPGDQFWFETLWTMRFYKLVGFSEFQLSTCHFRKVPPQQ